MANFNTYSVDGVEYPRVTTILGIIDRPELRYWYAKVGANEAKRISDEAKQFGTDFHSLCHEINLGEHRRRTWHPPSQFKDMAYAYINWMSENLEEISHVEHQLISKTHVFGGTADLIARPRGKDGPYILDIKTSKSPSVEWPLQLAAYSIAAEENGIPIVGKAVIHVSKIGKAKVTYYDYNDPEGLDKTAFFAAYELWRWHQGKSDRLKRAKGVGAGDDPAAYDLTLD